MDKGAKRSRTANWLEEDKVLLQELIKEHVSVVENKNTDTNTNQRKKMAWEEICNSFNAMCGGHHRNVTQLKNQWGNMKMNVKKELSVERKKLFATGGGPAVSTQTPPRPDSIVSWLPSEFATDVNEFDSDSVNVKQRVTNEASSSQTDTILVVRNEDAVAENKENEEPAAPSTLAPPPSTSTPRLFRKRKRAVESDMAAEHMANISDVETACRQELHRIQMENEKIRQQNLLLEQEILKENLKFAQKRNKDN